MSKVLIRTLALVLSALFICSLFVGALPVKAEEIDDSQEKTTVVFRLIWNDPYKYASASVTLDCYDNPEGEGYPIKTMSFNITRSQTWEFQLELEPGYYSLFAIPTNEWKDLATGETEIIEVRGEIMTVYCPVLRERETLGEYPDELIIYDKIDDTYYIWEQETETTPSGTDEPDTPVTRDPGTLVTDDPLVTKEPKERENDPSRSQGTPNETKSSKIGTWIFTGLLISAVVVCGVVLVIKRNR